MANIDFTARDFDDNVAALQRFIRSTRPDQWTSFFPGDVGQTLLELVAYDSALNGYVIDKTAAENFLSTLTSHQSFNVLAFQYAYSVRRGSPSTLSAMVESRTVPVTDLTLRRGTPLQSSDGLSWEVVADVTVAAGNSTPRSAVTAYGGELGNSWLKFTRDKSHAVLCDSSGNRLPSETAFPGNVSEGQVLVLTGQLMDGVVGPAPDASRNQWVILSVGKLEGDLFDRSVLYLDRTWDLDDATCTWSIEDRGVTLVQGRTVTDTFTTAASDNEWLELTCSAEGLVGPYRNALQASGLYADELDSLVTVTVNGTPWPVVRSLALAGAGQRACELWVNADDRLVVRFGDGLRGELVPASVPVLVRYRTCDGTAGNLTRGSFTSSVTVDDVSLVITNPYTEASGGTDKETLESAKAGLIAQLRANDRAVRAEDYVALALGFSDPYGGAVSAATATLRGNNVPLEQNVVWVHVWTRGPSGQLMAPGIGLKAPLLAYLRDRKMVSDEVVVLNGEVRRFPLHVTFRHRGHDTSSVKEAVRSALNGKLAELMPGQPVRTGDLYTAVTSVADVMTARVWCPDGDLPGLEGVAYSNGLLIPDMTLLTTPASRGGTTVTVSDPTPFAVGSAIMVTAPNRAATVSFVQAVDGNVVTLRGDLPLLDRYGAGARAFNSDLWLDGWSAERGVHVRITFTSGNDEDLLRSQVARATRDHVDANLRPGEALTVAALTARVGGIVGVSNCTVTLQGMGASVQPFQGEKVTVASLTVNGKNE